MLFFSYFRTLWLLPLSSPLIARLKAFSATIPTAPNSGFAKVTMEILNCTNAPLVTCSTMKKDDVWKKIKWNVTKRWTWLCYGQNPLMSINSKSHNWHRFSTDMQHCNFKKCNKVNGNWPAYREKKKRVNRFIIILSFRLHDLSRRMPTYGHNFKCCINNNDDHFCIRFEIRSDLRSISWLYLNIYL